MGDSQNGYGQGGGDEDARKLFLGGLPTSATKESVQSYFSQFGEVAMCTIKTDQFTGRSRGFGFLIFRTVEAVNDCLSKTDHEIEGKRIDPKLATPQGGQAPEKSTKVFVGGLDKSVTEDLIKEAFAPHNVVDIFLPSDRTTNELKGFAFVNFDSSSVAESLIAKAKIVINGKECDVKRANNKNESRGGGRGGFRGGRGSYAGRGRGGYGGYDSYGGYDQYSGGYGGGGYQGGYGGGGYGAGGGYGGGGYAAYNAGSGGYDTSGGYGL